jgi:DNA repair protein RecO
MAYLRDTVFVLRNEPYHEKDAWVSLYGQTHGKIIAIAKGARAWDAKQRGHLEPFSCAEVMIAKGAAFDRVAVAQSQGASFCFSADLGMLAVAGGIVDLVDRLTHPEVGDERVFHLLAETWVALGQLQGAFSVERGRLLVSVVSGRLLHVLGYRLDFDACARCRRPVVGTAFGSAEAGGLICQECRHASSAWDEPLFLSEPALKLLRFFDASPLEKVFHVTAPTAVFQEINRLMEAFVKVAPASVAPHAFRTLEGILA